jgi:hypothetical protein
MKRTISVLAAAGLLAAAVGCRRESSDVEEKLDKIATRLDSMDKKIDQLAQRALPGARPQQPQNEPDPKAIYAVPVADSDYPKGPATAKVTVVEAADFA